MVFLHGRASKAANVFQRARRAIGSALGGGAVELLQIEIDLQDVPKDQALKRRVVGVDYAFVIFDLFGERHFFYMTMLIMYKRKPSFYIIIVKRVGHAQHFGAGVLSVVVDAVLG